MGTLLREDQFLIHAGVAGINMPATTSWTSKDGGDVQAQNVNTRPGGMLPALDLGGPANRSDCTVKRQYSVELHPYIPLLERGVGNARMWVSWTPLDANGATNGDTLTLTGVLKEVLVPTVDANTAAAAFLTLIMSCDQEPVQP